jgi:multidrug efflux system membrane fusion protein
VKHLVNRKFFPAIAVIGASVLLASCGQKQSMNAAALMMMQAVPVRAVAAESSDVPLQVSAVGNVEAISSVDVKSRVAGQIVRVNFREGDDVRQGQPLFEIDPEPLQRQVTELQADIAKDDALQQQARANVNKDEAQLKQARAMADRGLALAKDGIYSKEQTEQVTATADSAQASLEADRAAVESAAASKNADVAKLAETSLQLTYTKIAAPISGRAGAVSVKAGNLIKDNDTTLVNLLQVSPIYVSFGLPEQLLPEVRKYGAAHPLEITAIGADQQSVTGRLQFVDNTVDTTTGTVKMKAAFDNSKRILWPGQFVNVRAQLEIEHGRILIPSQTLQTGPDGKYVWVMNPADATVAMRPVTVLRLYQGATGATEQAVVGTGLRAGEMVISEGQMRLAPGAKVRLLAPKTEIGKTTLSGEGTGRG